MIEEPITSDLKETKPWTLKDFAEMRDKKSSGMTSEEFLTFHKKFTDKMHSIAKAKNADYAGSGEDAFKNFTNVESRGIATTEQGFLTRMEDKMSRIISFMNNGDLQVKDESVIDTLMDLPNYCILLAAYWSSKYGYDQTFSD